MYAVQQTLDPQHLKLTKPQAHPDVLTKWHCTIATAIKANLQSRTDILVSTGGASYLATSAPDAHLSCAALDVIAIHAYGIGDLTKDVLTPYVQKARKAGKKPMMQEWGMCYFDTANNVCDSGALLSAAARDANIKKYVDEIGRAGIPWMYWQIVSNADPHDGYDYEVGTNNANWGALKASARVTQQYASAFDFSKWPPS